MYMCYVNYNLCSQMWCFHIAFCIYITEILSSICRHCMQLPVCRLRGMCNWSQSELQHSCHFYAWQTRERSMTANYTHAFEIQVLLQCIGFLFTVLNSDVILNWNWNLNQIAWLICVNIPPDLVAITTTVAETYHQTKMVPTNVGALYHPLWWSHTTSIGGAWEATTSMWWIVSTQIGGIYKARIIHQKWWLATTSIFTVIYIGEQLYLIGEQEYLIGFTKKSNRVQQVWFNQ